jgi:hemerythrin-like metal-binding protein
MPIITWNDLMSTHIEPIDSQHKVLVDLINKLHDATNDGREKEVLGDVLKELIDYTEWHFAAEEGPMTAHGYPNYEKHKQEHKKLTEQVRDIKRQFEPGGIEITMDVMRFLKGWLTNHIIDVDKRLGTFLLSQGLA